MSKPSLSSSVDVVLSGVEYELVPSLKAATAISRAFDGLANAYGAIAAGRLDAYQAICRAGISRNQISNDDLNEAVYSTGLGKLSTPLVKFITILQNGGRDPDEADDEEEAVEGNDEV